jgi:hypothetical protein
MFSVFAAALVKTLVSKGTKKKTSITSYRVYKALQDPKWKEFKDKRNIRGKSSSFDVKRHNIPQPQIQVTTTGQQIAAREPTCAEIIDCRFLYVIKKSSTKRRGEAPSM